MKCNIKLKCKMLEGPQSRWWVLLRISKWDGLGCADKTNTYPICLFTVALLRLPCGAAAVTHIVLFRMSYFWNPGEQFPFICCIGEWQLELFQGLHGHETLRVDSSGLKLNNCMCVKIVFVGWKKKKVSLFLHHQRESFYFFSYLDFSFMISSIDYILCSVISHSIGLHFQHKHCGGEIVDCNSTWTRAWAVTTL